MIGIIVFALIILELLFIIELIHDNVIENLEEIDKEINKSFDKYYEKRTKYYKDKNTYELKLNIKNNDKSDKK